MGFDPIPALFVVELKLPILSIGPSMYSSCLFCTSDLGRNEEIEVFPVGGRLAFDVAKGRLWVVCRKCERWNLTPIEERWEALETCERLYRGTRLRVSTDNIGLARLASGLELVRIGSALRPELAAWRYGDQFGRRRRRHLLYLGGAAALGAGIAVAGPVLGLVSASLVSPLANLFSVSTSLYRSRKIVRLPREAGEPLAVRLARVRETRLVNENGSWALHVSADSGIRPGFLPRGPGSRLLVQLTGREALHAAGILLPHFNRAGGGKKQVQEAVQVLERSSSPEEVFRGAAIFAEAEARRRRRSGFTFANYRNGGGIGALPSMVRLALEMAAHEETERRALEGELALLEAAWRDAEEIAGIADDLLTPEKDREFIERTRRKPRVQE